MKPSVKNQFIFFLLVMLLPFENYACNSKQPPPPAKESSEESTSVEAYVINGQSSQPGEFPHQVALHPATSNATFCGGSIISPHLILTAAHCLDDMPPKYIKITAGLTDMTLLGKGNEQSRNVGFIYIHEKYEIDSKVNDIAIIELDSPLEYNANVKNINLPKLNETFKGDVTITGWGMTEQKNEQSYSNELKKVKLRIVSNEKCKKLYPKSRFPVTENNLCAGVKDSGMCNGDSGGPAICRRSGVTSRSNDNSGWVLCGITSFGNSKCGESPGVCTRVASYIDWIAEAENDLASARRIVERGNRGSVQGDLESPLHRAVSLRNKAIALYAIKSLIEMGADPTAEDKDGCIFLHKLTSSTFLQLLSPSQFEDFAEFLVSQNLAHLFNIRDNNFGRTPLMLAAKNVELEMATISLLKENGADLSPRDKNGSSYLSYAADNNMNTNLLIDLAKNGSIALRYKELMPAIEKMDEESVKVLIRLGDDVNQSNSRSATPLHIAATSDNNEFAIKIIKLLIDAGAKAGAKDRPYDQIFLHRMLIVGTTISPTQFDDMADFLCSRNLCSLFSTKDMQGTTPFQWAVRNVEVEKGTLSLLKNKGVDFNTVDNEGWSVLFYATRGNRTLRLISDLVDLGANPKHLTKNNENMIHAVGRGGSVELLKFFLDKGLDVNAQNELGETPLHSAVKAYYKENIFKIVQALLRNGADSDIESKHGWFRRSISPQEYFEEHRSEYPEAEEISKCFSLGSSC